MAPAASLRPSCRQLPSRGRAKHKTQCFFQASFLPKSKPKETVQLGPLTVSSMGLGTWAWGNRFLWNYNTDMDDELQEVFNLVVKNGVNLFDTADSYGTGDLNGKSEILLGRFIKQYPGSQAAKENLHVATKFAAYPWRVFPSNMVAACKGSLKRLGSDQISLAQLHWSTANYAILQEYAMWNGLADCYDQGLVKAIGVSNYGPKQLQKLCKFMDSRGVPVSSAQIQYSLLSVGTVQQNAKAACDDAGLALISYSPLALGLLTGKYSETNLPPGPRGSLFKSLLPEIKPLLITLEAVASSRKKTMSQVSINWCMCKGGVPIPGAKNLSQARDNLGAMGWRLSEGEVMELDVAAGKCKKTMVQNIFQTN